MFERAEEKPSSFPFSIGDRGPEFEKRLCRRKDSWVLPRDFLCRSFCGVRYHFRRSRLAAPFLYRESRRKSGKEIEEKPIAHDNKARFRFDVVYTLPSPGVSQAVVFALKKKVYSALILFFCFCIATSASSSKR